MPILGTKCHQNVTKLPEMNVYCIHFLTIEKSWGYQHIFLSKCT